MRGQTRPALSAQALEAVIEEHVSALKRAQKGKLSDAQIKQHAKTIAEAFKASAQQLATQSSYSASGSISVVAAYNHIYITCGSKVCQGDGGGVFSVGSGYYWGHIYTSDLNKLFSDTVSYQLTLTAVYASVVFFDSHSNNLGSFQGGGFCLGAGVGGGVTKWS